MHKIAVRPRTDPRGPDLQPSIWFTENKATQNTVFNSKWKVWLLKYFSMSIHHLCMSQPCQVVPKEIIPVKTLISLLKKCPNHLNQQMRALLWLQACLYTAGIQTRSILDTAIFYWLYVFQRKSLKALGITLLDISNLRDVETVNCNVHPQIEF